MAFRFYAISVLPIIACVLAPTATAFFIGLVCQTWAHVFSLDYFRKRKVIDDLAALYLTSLSLLVPGRDGLVGHD